METTSQTCELCGSQEKLTKHHLIPQLKCKNKYKTLKNDESNFLWICEACHRAIHATYNEHELRDRYNTKELLVQSEEFGKFLKWRMKHIGENVSPTKMSNNRKPRYR